MQKILGAVLLLLALNIVALDIVSLTFSSPAVWLSVALILPNIAVFGWIIAVVLRSIHSSLPEHPGHNGSPSEAPEKSSMPDENTTLEETPVPEEIEEDDEDDDSQQLEEPNMDDFIFFQKVEALMVNEKLFCEQELSREDVAAAIGTNRTYLVRSIKTATGKTFSSYITDLRVNYAAKLLTSSDEPLDLIATLVGFRSKSAYYRAFSAAFNCSPAEYRRNSVSFQTLENSNLL
ncbi:MAG: helix-turn-helix transcriptional regulator [Bacteroidales bacterium]|nr:helix-turn-helix transcriptional regulator [Bacteroidales bacterium]